MKALQCDACTTEIQGETFEEWFRAMHAHYKDAHAEAMEAMASQPMEEGEKWMADAKARYEMAE